MPLSKGLLATGAGLSEVSPTTKLLRGYFFLLQGNGGSEQGRSPQRPGHQVP